MGWWIDPVQVPEASADIPGMRQISSFDSDKVRRFRQAIRAGLYRVDARAVADRLIVQARRAPMPGARTTSAPD